MSLYLRALVDSERGSLETSRASAAEALRQAERDDDARMTIRSLRVLGSVELSVADSKSALPPLERALGLCASCGYRETGIFRVEGDAIEAMVGCGDLDAAEAVAGELEARGRELGRVSALAAAARGRALIASAQGQHTSACDALDDARTKYERLNQPLEVGRTLLVRGIVQRRLRQKATARDSLGEAARIFDRCGALQWAMRARSEMARIGGRPVATDDLAPAEAEVARLAVQGRANRQIAAELHMSVKTVEAHLSPRLPKAGRPHTRRIVRVAESRNVGRSPIPRLADGRTVAAMKKIFILFILVAINAIPAVVLARSSRQDRIDFRIVTPPTFTDGPAGVCAFTGVVPIVTEDGKPLGLSNIVRQDN